MNATTRKRGILYLVAASGIAAASLFLASQIPATPDLKVDIGILATLGLVGSLTLAINGIGLAFGRINFDARGMKVRCGFERYSFSWNELLSWTSMESMTQAGFPAMRFTLNRVPRTREIPSGHLSPADLEQLIAVVRAHSHQTTSSPTPHRRHSIHVGGAQTARV